VQRAARLAQREVKRGRLERPVAQAQRHVPLLSALWNVRVLVGTSQRRARVVAIGGFRKRLLQRNARLRVYVQQPNRIASFTIRRSGPPARIDRSSGSTARSSSAAGLAPSRTPAAQRTR
jgi:hypothetical protein